MTERIPIHAFDMSCIMHQSPGLYEQPYALARRFGTLDHLTGGRIGWNIVTSYLDGAARNLGMDRQMSHDERYELAEEVVDVCYKLWEGWRAFAARNAEAVFTVAPTPQTLRPFVDDIRRIAAEHGRDPRSIKVFTEITTVVAASDSEAKAKYDEYLKWMGPVIVGSPTTVADELERWVDEADITGFNLAYAVTPGTFVEFIELVVPELQRRGRYWQDYDEGTTLREKIYGPGQTRVRDDHPAAVYRRAMQDRAAVREKSAVELAGR